MNSRTHWQCKCQASDNLARQIHPFQIRPIAVEYCSNCGCEADTCLETNPLKFTKFQKKLWRWVGLESNTYNTTPRGFTEITLEEVAEQIGRLGKGHSPHDLPYTRVHNYINDYKGHRLKDRLTGIHMFHYPGLKGWGILITERLPRFFVYQVCKHPKTEETKIGKNLWEAICQTCGQSWQIDSTD